MAECNIYGCRVNNNVVRYWAILGRVSLESRQKLDRFFAGVERRVFRMAVVATGNQDDALDIIQDAMIKLVKLYADRDEKEWGPLFHRIVQTTIRDWYRRQRVRRRLLGFVGLNRDDGETEKEDFADTGAPAAHELLDHSRMALRLDRALHRLPLRQQQAFMLRAWEGQSVADTARAMGCSEGSVKTHYSRAVHALRDLLEDYRP